MYKPRIAIVSPFINKSQGTERSVAECMQLLSGDYEIHLYSNRVEDVDLKTITWHRIPALPGPHLSGYLWWFLANHIWRWYDRHFKGLIPEVVFSPGINCLDANAIHVHIVFKGVREKMKEQLRFFRHPLRSWHKILHRRIYYSLISSLESRIYAKVQIPLVAVSQKTANDLSLYYSRNVNVQVAYHGIDLERFQPTVRATLRTNARRDLHLADGDFSILFIGNDWKIKGLPCLLEAVQYLHDSTLVVLVVGHDNHLLFQDVLAPFHGARSVRFLPNRRDVEFYYAAADVYASPSREDSFGLPAAEAMASGLPVITSRFAGVAEIMTHGQDGFVLEDPSDFRGLSTILRNLNHDPKLRQKIGSNAVASTRKLTWEATAEHIRSSWEVARRIKTGRTNH